MLFRLGGLFLLCLLGAYALSTVWPFSVLTLETGVVATLTVYIPAALYVARSYRQHRGLNVSPRMTEFPLWPTRNSSYPIVFVVFLLVEAVLMLTMYFARPAQNSIVLNAGIAILGAFAFSFSTYAVKFGYFPSVPGRFSGVSRKNDLVQFWVMFTVFVLLGLLFLYIGISGIWSSTK